MTRIAILISGGGSNMAALLRHMKTRGYAEPVLVASNRPAAKGLALANAAGVETAAIDHTAFNGDREAFEAVLTKTLRSIEPDFICLAGFMRVLTASFVEAWPNQILNIHPSLLPKYKGLNTHARAIDAGDSHAGCTVHRVTSNLDDGPILGQAQVPVNPDDTPQTLAARILPMEHQLYPAVLERVVSGENAPLFLSLDKNTPMKAGR